MNNKYSISSFTFLLFILMLIFFSCKKNTINATAINYSLTENFNSLSDAQANGWVFINNSRNIGTTTWQAGNGTLFAGYNTDAAASDYVAIAASCANPFDTSGNFNPKTEISAWMITPVLTVKNGDAISFYTRTTDIDPYIPERLELRQNQTGTDANVGSDTSSVGSFTKIVLSINPTLIPGAYPNAWTNFSYSITGVSNTIKTRFAFRYYKPVNTLGAANYYYELGYIGIDAFTFTSN